MIRRRTLFAAAFSFVAFTGAAHATCASTCTPAPGPQSPGPQEPGMVNTQTNTNDVSATNDVWADKTTHASSAATAGANNASVGAHGQSIRADSVQTSTAATNASAMLGFGQVSGVAVTTSYSVANGFASSVEAGALTASIAQSSTGATSGTATTDGTIVGKTAVSQTSATAAGNGASFAARNGDLTVAATQTGAGAVSATSKSGLTACCGSATSSALATGNNTTAAGSTTTLTARITQSRTGGDVTAASDIAVAGSSGAVNGSATANGNAATIQNAWGYVDVAANQRNTSNTLATSWVTVDDACCATASAFGVGNAFSASNVGSDMRLGIDQANDGAVSGWSALGGSVGNGVVTASAIGNSASGVLCTQCGEATMTVRSAQTNAGAIDAVGVAQVTNGGSVIGAATAFGNTATYYAGQTNH